MRYQLNARSISRPVWETHSGTAGKSLQGWSIMATFQQAINLVRNDHAGQFTDQWRARYLEAFPAHADRAEFFTTRPGRPAEVRAD